MVNLEEGWTHDGYSKKTDRPEFCGDHTVDRITNELLGKSPTGNLWSLMWEWRHNFEGTIWDMSECGNVSRPSIYKILPTFLKYEWIIPSRKERGNQLYKLNKKNYLVKQMMKLIDMHMDLAIKMSIAEEEAKDEVALKYKTKRKKKGL